MSSQNTRHWLTVPLIGLAYAGLAVPADAAPATTPPTVIASPSEGAIVDPAKSRRFALQATPVLPGATETKSGFWVLLVGEDSEIDPYENRSQYDVFPLKAASDSTWGTRVTFDTTKPEYMDGDPGIAGAFTDGRYRWRVGFVPSDFASCPTVFPEAVEGQIYTSQFNAPCPATLSSVRSFRIRSKAPATSKRVRGYEVGDPTSGLQGSRASAFGPLKSGVTYNTALDGSDWYRINVRKTSRVTLTLLNKTLRGEGQDECLTEPCLILGEFRRSNGTPMGSGLEDRATAYSNTDADNTSTAKSDRLTKKLKRGVYYVRILGGADKSSGGTGEPYSFKVSGALSSKRP